MELALWNPSPHKSISLSIYDNPVNPVSKGIGSSPSWPWAELNGSDVHHFSFINHLSKLSNIKHKSYSGFWGVYMSQRRHLLTDDYQTTHLRFIKIQPPDFCDFYAALWTVLVPWELLGAWRFSWSSLWPGMWFPGFPRTWWRLERALGRIGTAGGTEGPGGSGSDASEHSWDGLDRSSSSLALKEERCTC